MALPDKDTKAVLEALHKLSLSSGTLLKLASAAGVPPEQLQALRSTLINLKEVSSLEWLVALCWFRSTSFQSWWFAPGASSRLAGRARASRGNSTPAEGCSLGPVICQVYFWPINDVLHIGLLAHTRAAEMLTLSCTCCPTGTSALKTFTIMLAHPPLLPPKCWRCCSVWDAPCANSPRSVSPMTCFRLLPSHLPFVKADIIR